MSRHDDIFSGGPDAIRCPEAPDCRGLAWAHICAICGGTFYRCEYEDGLVPCECGKCKEAEDA